MENNIGIHVGGIADKHTMEPLIDAISQIMEAKNADQSTIRLALSIFDKHLSAAVEAKNITLENAVVINGDNISTDEFVVAITRAFGKKKK